MSAILLACQRGQVFLTARESVHHQHPQRQYRMLQQHPWRLVSQVLHIGMVDQLRYAPRPSQQRGHVRREGVRYILQQDLLR